MKKINRKIIRRLIIEEAKVIRNEKRTYQRKLKSCAILESKLINEGYTLEESKEIVLNEFFDAGVDSLKRSFGDWLAESLGVDTTTFMYDAIQEIIEQVSIDEFMAFVTGSVDRCDLLVQNIADGLIESAGNQLIEYISGMETSGQGLLLGSLREIITNFMRDTSVAESLKNSIKSVVCNFSFSDLSGTSSPSQGSEEEKNIQLATKIATADPGLNFGDIGRQISQYSDLLGRIRNFVPDLDLEE